MRTSPAFAPIRLSLILFVALVMLLPIDLPPRVGASPIPTSLSSLPSSMHSLRVEPLLNSVLERLQALSFGATWLPKPVVPVVPAAPAVAYTVNSLGDAGAGSGTTGDLRYCLTQANAAGGVNTINFGVTGTITLGSELTITNSVTVQGPGMSQLTISGNNAVRVFNISSGSFAVTLADLTIANGLAPVSFFSAQGGGILNNSTGTLNITNCTLSGNTAAMSGANTSNMASGGGIFNASTSNVNVINSMFSGNTVSATNAFTNNFSRGGGIYNAGAGAVTVTSSTLSNNSVFTSGPATVNYSFGGSIYNHDTGAVNVINSTLSNNSVTSGGAVTSNQSNGAGIYNVGLGTVTVTGSTLSSNSATANGSGNNGNNSNGGGIYNGSTGIVKVTGSTLANNSAAASGNSVTSNSGSGGGIYCGPGTVYVTNSTLASNTVSASGSPATTNAGRGGGIYNPGGTLLVTNGTLSGNAASASGSNPARQGGGIFSVGGTANVKNSIVAGNTAITNPDVFGTFTSQGYNLIGNNTGSSSFTNGVNNDQAGSAAFPLDPLLGPLQNNGGSTPTMALLNGSPAVDKGAAATDPATGNLITTDQLGSLRPVDQPGIAPATGGDNSDIGAFEIPPSSTCAMPVIDTQPQSHTICSGTPVTFSVAATGTNLMYQWRKGSNPIDGANSSSYTIPAAAAGDQDSYDVVVTGTCGTLTSNPATLTVNAVTTITTPPASQTNLTGESVTFNVAAQGTHLSYQWRKGGNGISGATGSSYTINNLSLADAGSYDVIVSGTCGVQTSAAATLVVNCPELTVHPATLPNAPLGASYNQTISATGGTAPYNFTVTGGALPGGLTLSPQGQLAGSLNVAGSFTFTISTQDSAGCTSARAYTLVTNAPPGLSPIPLSRAAGSNGAAFTIATVSDAETAVNQLQFMLSSDGTNFGPTATLNGVTVTLNGINPTGQVTALVTTTCAASTAAFTLKVTDAAGASTTSPWTVTVPVNTPPVLNYSAQTVALGQASTVNPISGPSDNGTLMSLLFHSVTPALSGVSVDNTSGVVTISNAAVAGNYTVIIRATDNCGAQTDATFTLNITSCPTLSLTPATLPNGLQGTDYNQTLTGAPAGTTYSFAVTTGSLPPGLTLASNGTLSGTPSAPGNYTFGITATGWGACTRAQSFNLLITGTCASITINPATLPAGTIGTAYNQTVAATGGTAPYIFSVSQGALPPGLVLDTSTGALTGTPTQGGTFSFRITAMGTGGCTGSRQYVATISCATPTFNPTTLPNATRNLSYSQTIRVSPAGTSTFSLLLGSLPPGFTLSSAGVLSGITNQAGTFNFTVKALSGTCQSTKAYALVVSSGAAALAQMADYDGDGRGDFALWSNTGAWRLLLSNGGPQRSAPIQSWGTPGDVPLRGDYDGDGLTDLALFRPANGTWYLKHSSDGSALVKAWGAAGDVPVPGDYDGDGQTDIAVFRPNEGNWYIVRSSDQQYAVTAWGAGYAPYNDVAVPGDYDGDGQTDLAVFRRATGTWLVKRSSDGQYQVKPWGATTDIPVAADYDGDGQTDLAVWRQGVWYIWQSATDASRIETWGSSAAPYFDQAVPGDYDGDGKADVAVWRAPAQTWYVLCSRYSNVVSQAQGQAGDAPVSGKL